MLLFWKGKCKNWNENKKKNEKIESIINLGNIRMLKDSNSYLCRNIYVDCK